MTKNGQTTNYKASDHLIDLKKYLGRAPDFVLINNGEIDEEIKAWYKKNNEVQVENDLTKKAFTVISSDLVDNDKIEKSKSDILYRSILRHDSKKITEVLKKIFYA